MNTKNIFKEELWRYPVKVKTMVCGDHRVIIIVIEREPTERDKKQRRGKYELKDFE